jgi:hypothetical protein
MTAVVKAPIKGFIIPCFRHLTVAIVPSAHYPAFEKETLFFCKYHGPLQNLAGGPSAVDEWDHRILSMHPPGASIPKLRGFREDPYRAREVRGDFSFGEQILDIADNTTDDWSYNPENPRSV